MSWKLITTFTLLLLLTCLRDGGDGAVPPWLKKAIEKGLSAIKKSEQLAEEARKAGHLREAIRYSDDAAREAKKVDEAARQLPSTSQLLGMIEEAHVRTLRTQQEDAIARSMRNFEVEPGPFANRRGELERFLRNFACLHLEPLVLQRPMPSDRNYQDFLRDEGMEKLIPVYGLKSKAVGIIEFARKASEAPRSGSLVQAQAKLFEECHWKR